MSLPKISVTFSEGNLLKAIANADGFGSMLLTGSTRLGEILIIYSLTDAEDLGITETDEAYAYRQIKEFYAEIGGNQKLYIMLVASTMTMESMLDTTNPTGALKLCSQTNREISLLAIGHNPTTAYDGGTDFYDADVAKALLKSNAFGANRAADLNFICCLVEGKVANPSQDPTEILTANEAKYASVITGGSLADGSASIGAALGRLVANGVHIKAGKVANGPLQLTEVYIGDDLVEERNDLATIQDNGSMTFMQHPGKAGYYFTRDVMANTGDYRYITNRRVVNKAAVIAAAVAIEEIEGEVEVESNGNIASHEILHLQAKTLEQIDLLMSGQISGRELYINPEQDIINNSTLEEELGIQPLAYKSIIKIGVGLQSEIG